MPIKELALIEGVKIYEEWYKLKKNIFFTQKANWVSECVMYGREKYEDFWGRIIIWFDHDEHEIACKL